MDNLDQLYHQLESIRSKFGIWACNISRLGDEKNIAVQLGAEAVDLASKYQQGLNPDSVFLGINVGKLTELISTIGIQSGKTRALVYDVDILLSRLSPSQRKEFWEILLIGLIHNPRCLVLMIPESASKLLPSGEELDKWVKSKRITFSN